MKYENLRFIVSEVSASQFRTDMNGKTPTFVNVTALHNGDDALVYEAPIQSAPKVGDSMTVTVEWGDDDAGE